MLWKHGRSLLPGLMIPHEMQRMMDSNDFLKESIFIFYGKMNNNNEYDDDDEDDGDDDHDDDDDPNDDDDEKEVMPTTKTMTMDKSFNVFVECRT